MCCRYYLDESPEIEKYSELAKRTAIIDQMSTTLGRLLKTEGEIYPTDMVPVIATSRTYNFSCFPMVWGFQMPNSVSPILNARIETAAQKKLFKDSWENHRCVIPASWYFEWEHIKSFNGKTKTGKKYAIQPKGSKMTYLAGLYRMEKVKDLQIPVFTILTCPADESVKYIHDRMPVVLPRDLIFDWILPDQDPEAALQFQLKEMCCEVCD